MSTDGRSKIRVRVPRVETPLRRLRRLRTFTQAQMALVLTVSQQTYSKYEAGVIIPDTVTRAHIATLLGVTVKELWPQRRRPARPARSLGDEAQV